MEDNEGSSLLLIEIIDDPSDKKMPQKLKLNENTVRQMLLSNDRYVMLI